MEEKGKHQVVFFSMMTEASVIYVYDHFFLKVGILHPKSQKNEKVIILNTYT